MKISKIFSIAAIALAAMSMVSCNNKKFHVTGEISNAKDSTLYFENMSLNGPVVLDSVKLDKDGNFSFDGKAPKAPEFYRLRIAGQIINVSIDSTETVSINGAYPTMASKYEVKGSENCSKIKELAILQLKLQANVNSIINNPNLGTDAVEANVSQLLEAYKNNIKRNYIFKEPMKASSYFALFQTVVLGNTQSLIFNPRNNKEDIKVYAAVATSWDTYYPKAERGLNLHNIALQGMKDVRIIQAEQQQKQQIDASKVSVTGIIDIALNDNKGHVRKLSDLKGKVVLLDFHMFAGEGSLKRIMMLRELYNKYHAQGFEIYQVSVDPDEHFWKTQTSAIPWISVRDEDGTNSQVLAQYNVQNIPTFFIIGKDNVLKKRDAQIKDLDAEIKSLL
ncbi:TlpA disulfide reductase family protein [Segatella paludivivens]|uniref:TlpA disulfide reductase family protein n=1 Tax=Segatella paludivivens TaxID=185294 RepID=UPI00035D3854|nr:TlpA disulfide reductase family protein [Segatella paludivivens]